MSAKAPNPRPFGLVGPPASPAPPPPRSSCPTYLHRALCVARVGGPLPFGTYRADTAAEPPRPTDERADRADGLHRGHLDRQVRDPLNFSPDPPEPLDERP